MKFSLKRFEKDKQKSKETKFDNYIKPENLKIERTARIIRKSRELSAEENYKLNILSENCEKKTVLEGCKLPVLRRGKSECSMCDANI